MDSIGKVYTPVTWASWLIEQVGAVDLWLGGASVCDPTFGDGAFIKAFLLAAKQRNVPIDGSLVSRLHGYEINLEGRNKIIRSARDEFGVILQEENFITADVLSKDASGKYDILVGNPPWVNFSDLPNIFREKWGYLYLKYGLVANKKDVLLGASRADLSTLILKKVIEENLEEKGLAAFFIPLSIFFNDGSNDKFRPFPGSSHRYVVERLWDFSEEHVFDDVATRYGCVQISLKSGQRWPVPTDVRSDGDWRRFFSVASDGIQGFWRRQNSPEISNAVCPSIRAMEHQKPRQGINTCGANHIFLMRRVGSSFVNANGEVIPIEEELMFPLMGKTTFKDQQPFQPDRYILVPHDPRTGKPFSAKDLKRFPLAAEYLKSHREALIVRKGTMIGGHIRRGLWWSLLGVGSYSFAPFKVAWEALGKRTFNPRILPGIWQGNQAQHAFCACYSDKEAETLASHLRDPSVQDFLTASAMGGTMNWAQPGRVARLFQFENIQSSMPF